MKLKSGPLAPREEQPLLAYGSLRRRVNFTSQDVRGPFRLRSERAALRRRGASLIEMVTVIALLGSLLTMTATTMHRVIRTEAVARHVNVRLMALHRAATLFRQDVHAATAVTIADGGRRLTCTFADQAHAEYMVDATALERTRSSTDSQPLREAFRLHDAKVRFHSQERSGHTVYTMQWDVPATGVLSESTTEPSLIPIPVDAVARRTVVEHSRWSLR